MAKLTIQLLAFNGCPLADAARQALDDAMAALNLGSYEVVEILDPDTPEEMKNLGVADHPD